MHFFHLGHCYLTPRLSTPVLLHHSQMREGGNHPKNLKSRPQIRLIGTTTVFKLTWACAGLVTAGCWRKIVCFQVERSVLTAWGPGARSRAPGGVQGAEPPEAPGFSGFFRPQNASPRIVFLLFWRQVFLQNHLIYYYIRWYNDEGSFIIFRYRLLYCHTEALFWFWHWRAQGECLRVMWPPWKAWFFLKLESCNLLNTFGCKNRTGDEKDIYVRSKCILGEYR